MNSAGNKGSTVFLAIILAFAFQSAQASIARYDYVGPLFNVINNFAPDVTYDETMGLTGYMIFANPLLPDTTYLSPETAGLVEFSFFDGIQTLNSANAGFDQSPARLILTIGPSGLPILWSVDVIALPGSGQPLFLREFVTTFQPDFPSNAFGDYGLVMNSTSPGCERSGCVNTGAYVPNAGDANPDIGIWSVSAVPLPSAFALLAGGVICLGIKCRR